MGCVRDGNGGRHPYQFPSSSPVSPMLLVPDLLGSASSAPPCAFCECRVARHWLLVWIIQSHDTRRILRSQVVISIQELCVADGCRERGPDELGAKYEVQMMVHLEGKGLQP